MVIRPMGKLLLLPDHKMDQDIQVVSEILTKFGGVNLVSDKNENKQ